MLLRFSDCIRAFCRTRKIKPSQAIEATEKTQHAFTGNILKQSPALLQKGRWVGFEQARKQKGKAPKHGILLLVALLCCSKARAQTCAFVIASLKSTPKSTATIHTKQTEKHTEKNAENALCFSGKILVLFKARTCAFKARTCALRLALVV